MEKKQYEKQMSVKREDFLEKGYELFSHKTIEAVNLTDVADASPYGIATLYRYFRKKPGFVVAVASWKWEKFRAENKKTRASYNFEGMTADRIYEFILDSFLKLYREQPDLLRFNQFFNIYVQSENIDPEVMRPYEEMILEMKEPFEIMYARALEDHTIRTDMTLDEIFSLTMHLMLAVVTRYAVGLVYQPGKGFDSNGELLIQKEMLLSYIREK